MTMTFAQPTDNKVVCPHCHKHNYRYNFICHGCGNLLDIPPQEKSTRMLPATSTLGFKADHFDEKSTLVMRVRGGEGVFQISADDLLRGQILGRNTEGHAQRATINLERQNAEMLGVSRRHARLCFDTRHQVIRIQDFNSANGTYINGQRLHPQEVRVLRHGDKLRLGRLELGVTVLQAMATVEIF